MCSTGFTAWWNLLVFVGWATTSKDSTVLLNIVGANGSYNLGSNFLSGDKALFVYRTCTVDRRRVQVFVEVTLHTEETIINFKHVPPGGSVRRLGVSSAFKREVITGYPRLEVTDGNISTYVRVDTKSR